MKLKKTIAKGYSQLYKMVMIGLMAIYHISIGDDNNFYHLNAILFPPCLLQWSV